MTGIGMPCTGVRESAETESLMIQKLIHHKG